MCCDQSSRYFILQALWWNFHYFVFHTSAQLQSCSGIHPMQYWLIPKGGSTCHYMSLSAFPLLSQGLSDPSLRHIWVKLSFLNSNSISLSVFLVSCIPLVFHLLIKKDLLGALLLLLGIPTVSLFFFFFLRKCSYRSDRW